MYTVFISLKNILNAGNGFMISPFIPSLDQPMKMMFGEPMKKQNKTT